MGPYSWEGSFQLVAVAVGRTHKVGEDESSADKNYVSLLRYRQINCRCRAVTSTMQRSKCVLARSERNGGGYFVVPKQQVFCFVRFSGIMSSSTAAAPCKINARACAAAAASSRALASCSILPGVLCVMRWHGRLARKHRQTKANSGA